MKPDKYTNEQFIDDLIVYFRIHTDRIDTFMNAKVNMKDTKEFYTNSIIKDRLKEVIKDMTKYKCTLCNKVWYTADPKAKKCHECGGKLKNEGLAK